jgi:hypothetical protein
MVKCRGSNTIDNIIITGGGGGGSGGGGGLSWPLN